MRRALFVLSTAALSLGTSAPAARADDAEGWHLAAALDVLTPGNAAKHELNAAKSLCAAPLAGGAASCAATVKTSPSFGIRVGTYRQSGGFYVGPSLGYLVGGPTAGKTTLTTVPAGSLARKSVEGTGRALLQFGVMFPLGDVWAVTLGAGAGAALVIKKETCADSGTLAGTCAASGFSTTTKKNGWATWELSPSVLYRSVEFGFRYVGFGRKKQLPWNTFGVFVGGRF
jgi:hypothetical protein